VGGGKKEAAHVEGSPTTGKKKDSNAKKNLAKGLRVLLIIKKKGGGRNKKPKVWGGTNYKASAGRVLVDERKGK